ncbi:MAG: choice-of-anchor Q domain-containing protein [Planctomycetota bacterium]
MNGRKHLASFLAGLTQDLISITIHSQCTQFILPDHFHETSLGKNKKIKTQPYLFVRLLLVSLLLGLMYSTASGNIIYVKEGGTGDGSHWANAYSDLQAALNDAVSNDQIWVAAGTYTPTDDYGLGLGARGQHFRMINGVAICGGFAGTETALGQRDIQANETILSGDLNGDDGPGFTNNSENCYHVFYHPLETELNATAILDGFTITGGNSDDVDNWPYDSGGGMYNEYCNPTVANCTFIGNTAFYGGGVSNYYSNPNISNCIFSNNSAAGDMLYEPSGGGMDNYYSHPLVFNCFFSQNSAVYGGGMNNLSSSPFVMDCTFSDNTASGDTYSGGGGISNFLQEGSSGISNPTVTHCIFSDNSAVYGAGIDNEYRDTNVTNCIFSGNIAEDGGGIYSFYSSPNVTACTFNGNTADFGGGMSNEDSNSLVVNCIFSGNTADFGGGGMENYYSNPTVTNCTFSGNTADFGGGLDNYESSPSISNSILWGNLASIAGDEIYNNLSNPTIAHSDILGGLPTGSTNGGGNIADDPLFLEISDDGGDGWGDANDDYGDLQLQGGSPCIDAGDNTVIPIAMTTDLDGESRFVDDPTVVDTGNGTAPIVDMGAYESDDPCLGRDKADFDCNGIVNMADFVYFASSWLK